MARRWSDKQIENMTLDQVVINGLTTSTDHAAFLASIRRRADGMRPEVFLAKNVFTSDQVSKTTTPKTTTRKRRVRRSTPSPPPYTQLELVINNNLPHISKEVGYGASSFDDPINFSNKYLWAAGEGFTMQGFVRRPGDPRTRKSAHTDMLKFCREKSGKFEKLDEKTQNFIMTSLRYINTWDGKRIRNGMKKRTSARKAAEQ